MVFRVYDYVINGGSDSAGIARCLADAAKVCGEKTIVFDGKDYWVDSAILVPVDTQILIDGCAIKQNDEVFDNVFRGANLVVDESEPYGKPLDVTPQANIKIIGKNGAEIVGTAKPRIGYHPVLNEQQRMNGDFWGWRTHMCSFSLGENIEIAGLKLSQTMGWAISFDACQKVYVHDLQIYSDVKNGDGIDFRSGCHDCVAENISGYTSDDTVACSALQSDTATVYPVNNYLYPSEPYGVLKRAYDRDVHDIKIKNITTGGLHHGVICLASRGNQVYNVTIEDVCETNEGAREATVKIYTGYGTGYTAGDIHDIRISNVVSQKAQHAVLIAAEVKNVTIENVCRNKPDGACISGAEGILQA